MKLRNQIATATGIFQEPVHPVQAAVPSHSSQSEVVQFVVFCISRARVGKEPHIEAEGFLRSKFYFVGCRFLSSRERPLDVRRAM